jgi:tRNA A-37 threonylcarbamoyl transferase component Bud32
MNEESLFAAALDKQDAAERRAFLDEACSGDPALRQRLEQLLDADEHARCILDRTTHAPPLIEAFRPEPPLAAQQAFAGRFTLRRKLGEGGMGEVWAADQTDPVRRRVALKVVRFGIGSARVLTRFEQERQALALMSHPNIAKVLDAGVEGGRPFFVMELIEGVALARYCDEAGQTIRQRLELFVLVCEAVQHAHQKGVIHRDLKPSNVLVESHDGRPVPKVIDFGLAKAAGPRITERDVPTEVGTLVGTLEYMSPEQADLKNQDIDTRSDVYSLGVLLYELLTGTTPFSCKEMEKGGLLEMLRVIREQEPSKPSTKLSTAEGLPALAANRGTEPAKLTRLVRGELDWIVMKALEKDRARRYETANGLAMDVRRYLADEPVAAGPPSAMYRLRKFARRNRAALTTAAAIGLLLVAGITISTWQAVRAKQAEADARAALDLATAVKEFLLKDLLQLAAPLRQSSEQSSGVKMDPDLKVRDLVLRAARKVEGKFKDQPLVEAEIRSTLGWTLREIGRADLA